ncbi:hypothetical protein GQ600_15696 [Phytophthora cactorum]|nr:hypothetical protein GQ600_15696 [Phytophthora cactorum]
MSRQNRTRYSRPQCVRVLVELGFGKSKRKGISRRAKISIQTRFGRTRSMGKWMTIDSKRNLIQQSYIKPEMTQTQLAEWLAERSACERHPPATLSRISNEGGVWQREKAKASKGEGP